MPIFRDGKSCNFEICFLYVTKYFSKLSYLRFMILLIISSFLIINNISGRLLINGSYDTSIYAGSSNKVDYASPDQKLRNFDRMKIESFRNNKTFDYYTIEKEPFNLMELLEKLFKNFFLKPLQSILGESLGRIIAIILFSSVFGLIIFKIFKSIIFKTNNKQLELSDYIDNINNKGNKIIYDDEIAKAVGNKDFTSALRFNYLKFLNLLFEAGLLKPNISKTNYDYCQEISDTEIAVQFKKLSDVFDFVLYGQFPLSQELYLTYAEQFYKLENVVKNYEKS